MSRLLSRNPYSQKETFWHDNDDGTYTIETKQHIKAVLDANKRKANDYQKAADEMVDSNWFKQVKTRGPRMVDIMRSASK